MAKKYLTLEEAAARLSMAKDDLVKMRESGAVRGFADRGNWKFKVDDIEELARNRSADSDPDVPIMRDTSESGFLDAGSDLTLGTESSVVIGGRDSAVLSDDDEDNFGAGLGTSDSDVRLVMDSGIDADESSLILGEADDSDSDISLIGDADSDSDVMLVGGESGLLQPGDPDGSLADADSDSDVKLVDADSDSDVKLLDDDSDSDVKLVSAPDSDSDIQLAPLDGLDLDDDEATDSDIALVGKPVESDSDIRLTAADLGGTDSDVRLVADDSGSDISLMPDFGSDSDVRLVADTMGDGSDSDVQLIELSSADLKTSDSDIALISSDDSAITLDLGDDDDRSVLGDASGVALGGDSSITLASESGISLEGPTDSGISLDLDMDDEGITLADDDDSGISLGDAGDSGIALAPGGLHKTQPMMDSAGDQDVAETQFEIPSLSGEQSDFDIDAMGDDGDTGVLDLQDSGEMDDAVFDLDDDESAEMDSLSDELELDDEFADDGDMEDLDVFEDDAEFEDGFQSGESQGELVIPTRAAAAETDWGTGPFVGLIVSTTLLAMLGLVMADLVHSMWSWNEPSAVAGMFVNMFGGMF